MFGRVRSRSRVSRRIRRSRKRIKGYLRLNPGNSEKTRLAEKRGEFARTYGEITKEGVVRLLKEIPRKGKGLIFYDLGCGQGAVVRGILEDGNFSEVKGVELDPNRYRIAKKIEEDFRKEGKEVNVSIYEDNLLKQKYFNDADVLFLSNLCYTPTLQAKVEKKLKKLKRVKGVKKKMIFSSKELNIGSPKIKDVLVPMTWNKNHKMKKYLI